MICELGMYECLKKQIQDGMPVLATCAGLILLAEKLSNDQHVYFGTLPAKVKRNAYGRQLGSFHTEEMFEGIGRVPMTFIRAPYIEKVWGDTKILAAVEEKIIAVRNGNQFAMAFHPELDKDNRIHELFIRSCEEYSQINS